MTSANDRTVEKIENMCGGKGHVLIERLLGEKELDGKCGLYAKVTIEKNCTLGYHEHHGETETYYILSGEGMYDDNGKKYPVKAGRRDVLLRRQRPRAGQHRRYRSGIHGADY